MTTSLHAPGHAPTPAASSIRVTEEEQRKLAQEYADYQKKLDQQKEELVHFFTYNIIYEIFWNVLLVKASIS